MSSQTKGAQYQLRDDIAALATGGASDFRATLFHVGTLWRLNELGLLRSLTRISSVSGGSITNGVLALAWPRLEFDAQGVARNFEALVVQPLRGFCSFDIGPYGNFPLS